MGRPSRPGAGAAAAGVDLLGNFDMQFYPDGSRLLVTVDHAVLGDGPAIHRYETMILDWVHLLTGIIDDDVRLNTAYEPELNSGLPLIVTKVAPLEPAARRS
ncbi:MAG: hypothetical protein IPK19_41835 [Chloroflexi bacterium]|nr:hypothetical protein [Chloroflexota bacterium]